MTSSLRLLSNKAGKTIVSYPTPKSIPPQRSMGVELSYNLKGQTKKQYSTDNGTGHPTKTTAQCDKPTCTQEKCSKPCGPIEKYSFDGHWTHSPVPDSQKDSAFISNFDANGQQKDQYFTKPKVKQEILGNDVKNLTEDDMKPLPKVNDYSKSLPQSVDNYFPK